MLCIWSSWCHCHPIISYSSKIQNGVPFCCRLTQVVPEKRPLNECSSSSSSEFVDELEANVWLLQCYHYVTVFLYSNGVLAFAAILRILWRLNSQVFVIGSLMHCWQRSRVVVSVSECRCQALTSVRMSSCVRCVRQSATLFCRWCRHSRRSTKTGSCISYHLSGFYSSFVLFQYGWDVC